jgi:hypothetical protein
LGVETPPIEKRKKFATRSWQFIARSGVTSVLATSWETLETHGFFNLRRGVSSIVFFIDEF